MSRIILKGPWLVAWALNVAFMYALVFYGTLVNAGLMLKLGMIWTAWFFVQEMTGFVVEARAPKGPEIVRTFSQFFQWFAAKDKGSSFLQTLTGWDAFVTASCLVAGYIAGYVAAAGWGVALGVIVFAGVASWNYGHWQNRRRHG